MVHLGRWSVLGVRVCLKWIGWDPNKAIAIGEWSNCGDGRLKGFYCSDKTCFSLKQEIEFLVPVSNGYLYQHRVGEMLMYAKRQDDDDKTPSISLLECSSTSTYEHNPFRPIAYKMNCS